MHKITRETMLGNVVYDDLHYTCACILALHYATNLTQINIVNQITDKQVNWLFDTACVSHSIPFEDNIYELAEQLLNRDIDKSTVNFTECWEKSVIYALLIKELFYETGLTITELFRKVYTSKLGTYCIDFNTAWPITPVNILLYESFAILDLVEYRDDNKVY